MSIARTADSNAPSLWHVQAVGFPIPIANTTKSEYKGLWLPGEHLVTASDEHARALGRYSALLSSHTWTLREKARGSPLGTLHCYTLPGVAPCRIARKRPGVFGSGRHPRAYGSVLGSPLRAPAPSIKSSSCFSIVANQIRVNSFITEYCCAITSPSL